MTEPASTIDRMHAAGNVLRGVMCAELVGVLVFAAVFIHANCPSGVSSQAGLIAAVAHSIGPFAGIVAVMTLLSEASTIVLLEFGTFCYRFQILRCPRWMIAMQFLYR